MLNAFRSDFSPKDEKGKESTAREKKSRQAANMEATGQTRPHFNSPEDVHEFYQALDYIKSNLTPKDYFDLDCIKKEIENLTLCCLDLASIVNQPIDNMGMIRVKVAHAGEKIHNVQLSALNLTLYYSQIEDYFEDLKNIIGQ